MSFGMDSGGRYDETGAWKRTKFCFVYCGDSCNCEAPNGVYQLEGTDLEMHLAKNKERDDERKENALVEKLNKMEKE